MGIISKLFFAYSTNMVGKVVGSKQRVQTIEAIIIFKLQKMVFIYFFFIFSIVKSIHVFLFTNNYLQKHAIQYNKYIPKI